MMGPREMLRSRQPLACGEEEDWEEEDEKGMAVRGREAVLRWEERMANSGPEKRWVVAGVRGRVMTRASRFWDRKVCRKDLEVPLNQEVGMVPVGGGRGEVVSGSAVVDGTEQR